MKKNGPSDQKKKDVVVTIIFYLNKREVLQKLMAVAKGVLYFALYYS